jgi:hypothetical protein
MDRRSLVIVIILITLIFPPGLSSTAEAQGGDDQQECLALLRQVMTDLSTNCANMDSNTVCYGFEEVAATFTDSFPEDYFSEPGDRAELTQLASITAAELDLQDEIWGIDVLRVQANVHNALPDDVVYLAVGGVTLENAVEPEDALLPVEPVSIATTAEAGLYDAPDAATAVVDTAATGTTLEFDGVSADGMWLRTYYYDDEDEQNLLAWVNTDVLDPTVNTDSLPVITADSKTPMQSFFLRNTYDPPQDCSLALPPMLLVQAPEDTPIDITVNGADIRVESTILLQILPPGDVLRVFVLYGMAILYPDTPNAMRLPAGTGSTRCLDPEGEHGGLDKLPNDRLVGTCRWTPPTLMPLFLASLSWLENYVPENIINYLLELLSYVEVSGVGGPFRRIVGPAAALRRAVRACNRDLLPDDICRRY